MADIGSVLPIHREVPGEWPVVLPGQKVDSPVGIQILQRGGLAVLVQVRWSCAGNHFCHANRARYERRVRQQPDAQGAINAFTDQIDRAISHAEHQVYSRETLGELSQTAAGRIAQIGFMAGQSVQLNLMPLIFRQTTIRGIAVAPRSSFDRMNVFLNAHNIRPVIAQVYPFEKAHEAYEHLAKGAFGKLVIKIA